MRKNLTLKARESISSVLPITIIVLALHFTVAPMPGGTLALFLVGAALLILGMSFFTLGADMAMMPMGESMGTKLTRAKKTLVLALAAFVIGALITVAEPDLAVLARTVPAVPDAVLIGAVAVGVGVFLAVALLRIVFRTELAKLLIILYAVVFAVAALAPDEFLAVAFDSGGVTTGPITVPFIMALGVGVAAVRGSKSARDDSFGLVALCSVGPILAVLVLGVFYSAASGGYTPIQAAEVSSARELLRLFGSALPKYAKEVAIALLPIAALFAVFRIFLLKLGKKSATKLVVGMVYTFVGLVLFLTGVNVGFMQAGHYLGETIASLADNWLLVPIGAVMGFFVVMAEPAVHVLNKQVGDLTVGAVPRRALSVSLSVGVAVSVAISMLRVLTGISIWYFLIAGYSAAILLSFKTPKLFTAIAFDSGGVASGPMTAAFMLPFAMGACEAVGGNMMRDAFGIVSMVALTPLITIQILGVTYTRKLSHIKKTAFTAPAEIELIEFDIGGER